ncbi:MAG: methylated-DNA--[protein]-cysteine S-methyltransferase, partial [Fimbriimonas ginsengisoli]|nr:methylated-DNA--[protein]-cysteine S-methyltransferase [Fimbriimonas ginsengisoli]
TENEMANAWRRRDAGYDGVFFFGVKTTGIFCRPSCPSRPKREHLEFFRSGGAAVRSGYRPCKRCRPELANGQPPEWIARLMTRVAESPDNKISACDLRSLDVPPERARRWFQKHHGMTFAAWCRGLRLSRAFTQIRSGQPMDDVIFGHGFESHSGFRTAFTRAFGKAPGKVRDADCLRVTLLDTPLGPMLAAAGNESVCQLEFADRRGLEKSYAEMRCRFALPVVPGENAVLQRLRQELQEYFSGARREFAVPLSLRGTDFQQRVWRELQRIPFGRTASYETVAKKIGSPAAVRAVARANATNRLYLLIPCHRVIAKDGTLSGYGGGKWRKRLLLELERTGMLPA